MEKETRNIGKLEKDKLIHRIEFHQDMLKLNTKS